jgi:glycosyltransferase involved in cell wall biosynthesis
VKVRILRPSRNSSMISARVFESLFGLHLRGAAEIQRVPLVAWHRALVRARAPLTSSSAEAFLAATAGADFLCPSYEGLPLLPWLLALRLRARSPIRLLLIAHAPGVSPLEWALLRPLLRPGDRIVVPSRSAASTLAFLCPELSPFVRIVPHPMQPLSARREAPRGLLALSRITPTKLLHRLIEAVALLGRRPTLRLRIAGPLHFPGGGLSPYARSLRAQVRRLGLADRVTFCGPVEGECEKAELLASAHLLVNLSVSLEESFGKAVVEALGLGVPVLATRWDGLRETVGSCGLLVPVTRAPGGLGVDVLAERIAVGIDELLSTPPPPQACRDHARTFAPERIVPLYGRLLQEALAERDGAGDAPLGDSVGRLGAAPAEGLLSGAAPLTAISWSELFELAIEDIPRSLALLDGASLPGRSSVQRLREILFAGLGRPLALHAAGLASDEGAEQTGNGQALSRPGDPLSSRLLAAAAARAVTSSRLACLGEALDDGNLGAIRAALQRLPCEGVAGSDGTLFLDAEVRLRGGDPAGAFRRLAGRGEEIAAREQTVPLLRTLARSSREAGCPEQSVPFLRAWLTRFPDAPDASGVWVELCHTLLVSQEPPLDEALSAYRMARDLAGDDAAVRLLAKRLFASGAGAAHLQPPPSHMKTERYFR